MEAEIKTTQRVQLKTLKVQAGVRYWEDAQVNGVDDEDGSLIPCRNGDYWCPEIDIDTGRILNWQDGKTANIHYKICDDGVYAVFDGNDNKVLERAGYVPSTMAPKENGYGDYIIMGVNASGYIANWRFNIEDFQHDS